MNETAPNNTIAGDESRQNQSDLDALTAQEKELANAQLEIAAKKAALAARSNAPRNPDALGLKARDAIRDLLAHRTGETDATKPEREAWQALGAFLEAACGN